jgi:two-component system, cell cycle sensor histidine kinase and response regulator CckA
MTEPKRPAILVVEDQAPIRTQIRRALERGGFSVVEANNVTEALEIFKANHETIVLAIIDIVMPGISGLDMASELNRDHPGVKILYISGYVGSVAMEVITRSSPEALLAKPFTMDALIERVRSMLGIRTDNASGV